MVKYLERLLDAMRPAFSRQAAFVWFVVIFAGFVLRNDTFGVSSIIRALWLAPSCYPCLLHFFHSSAWSGDGLLRQWWGWLVKENGVYRVGDRIVLVGDHTKTPKDGRRMPEVTTLHQDSETASKPSFFRGHQWGCIGLLLREGQKFFATPLWAEIHQDSLCESLTTRIVAVAGQIALGMGSHACLVLDAFFAVGPVFQMAAQQANSLHILTRAKKNVVAYLPPPPQQKPKRGRPPLYGKKLKLLSLFDDWASQFKTTQAVVYQSNEIVRYLTLDLIWKPIKRPLRFFLIETSLGPLILMTSDLTMSLLVALHLYSRRTTIETLFHTLKNILGAMGYHFWSKYLQPASRRPTKNKTDRRVSSRPQKTQNTLAAIEKFLTVQLIVLGALQLLAIRFPQCALHMLHCWLRTPSGQIPSEFVLRTVLANTLRTNLLRFAKDAITRLIRQKQSSRRTDALSRKAA